MTKKIKLTISGMHCASCATNVEKALKKVRGVNNTSVSIMTNKAIIEAEDNLNPEDLKKVIDKLGYKIVDVQ